MNWIQSLSKAIEYIESHLTEKIHMDNVSDEAYSSGSHFQLIFHMVVGMTIGEYIRNRRLSLAAQDLLQPNSKIIDVAMRYQYESPESFSKAFTRFHGVPPSKAQRGKIKLFHPLTIHVTVQGGFDMSHKLIEEFYWRAREEQKDETLTDAEKYQRLASWAGKARGQNPAVFDALTEWICDDAEWTDEKLAENEQILMYGVFGRFKEQNTRLRAYLKELEPSGVVNPAVFKALDIFDDELSGNLSSGSRPYERLQTLVDKVFANFSIMRERSVREQIAGNKTGIHGVDSVDIFGFINYLKGSDASVQWALFMPYLVERQQEGFKVESLEYKTMPAMRFIGKECIEHDKADMSWELEIMRTLDAMTENKSGFDHDVLFQHHYGKGVDAERWHGFWGRFMKADAPVPEGFVHWDFLTDDSDTPYLTFRSQFAFATFSGDMESMHKREGYDSIAMYDVTRNIILGQGINIPYPEIYWTAEVFLDGCDKPGTAYMFSVVL